MKGTIYANKVFAALSEEREVFAMLLTTTIPGAIVCLLVALWLCRREKRDNDRRGKR